MSGPTTRSPNLLPRVVAVESRRLDQWAAPTSALALGAQKITGLADPTSAQDAATRAFVLANGGVVDADAATKGKIQLAGDLAGTATAPTVPHLATLDIPAFIVGSPTEVAVEATVAAARMALGFGVGRAKILLPDAGLTGIAWTGAALPHVTGLWYEGVMPRTTAVDVIPKRAGSPAYSFDTEITFTGGTWFNWTGGGSPPDLFAGENLTDLAQCGLDITATEIRGAGIHKVGAQGFRSMVRCGAANVMGPIHCSYGWLTANYSTDWSFFFKNYARCNFAPDGPLMSFSSAHAMLFASDCDVDMTNPGNSYFGHLYVWSPRIGRAPAGCTAQNARGVVFACMRSGQNNDNTVTRLGVNRQNNTIISATATFTNGSPDIAVADISQYRVDYPVAFTTTAFGFKQGYTYVVRSVSGTSGAGTMQLSAARLDASPISATGSGTLTMETAGFANLEIVGNALGSVSNLSVLCGELEIAPSVGVYIEKGSCLDLHLPKVPAGNTNLKSVVVRGTGGGSIWSGDYANTDFDSASGSVQYNGRRGPSVNYPGIGQVEERTVGGGIQFVLHVATAGAQDNFEGALARRGSPGFMYPSYPLGERLAQRDAAVTLSSAFAGNLTAKPTVDSVFTLPTITGDVQSVTAAASTDVVAAAAHGLAANTAIVFPTLTGGAPLLNTSTYYAVNVTTDTYQVAATSGGAAIDITTDLTAGTVRRAAGPSSALLGMAFRIRNVSTGFTVTLNTDGTQLYNKVAAATSITIPAGTWANVVADKDSTGTLFWRMEKQLHAADHATAGKDPITPAAIGATPLNTLRGKAVAAPDPAHDQYGLLYDLATDSWLLASAPGGVAPDASATVKGVTKLSVAPASAIAPIAVGDNDPRVASTVTKRQRLWRPTQFLYESYSRDRTMTALTIVSGTLYQVGGIVLEAGVPVNTITMESGSTAAAAMTHGWFALIDQSRNVLAKTLDDAGSGTGDVASGSPTVTNLSSASSWVVGAGISGTGMPTGATVMTVNVGAASLTIGTYVNGVLTAANAIASGTGATLSPAWAASTPKALPLSATYTPVPDIAAYVGLVVVATTMPTITGLTLPSVLSALAPMMACTSNSAALTNPASLGSTTGAIAAGVNLPYCGVA